MMSASLASVAFFIGVGSFVLAGLGAMLGLPYIVFAEPNKGIIRDTAVQAIAVLLILTLIGAAGVLIGWGHVSADASGGVEMIEVPYAE